MTIYSVYIHLHMYLYYISICIIVFTTLKNHILQFSINFRLNLEPAGRRNTKREKYKHLKYDTLT